MIFNGRRMLRFALAGGIALLLWAGSPAAQGPPAPNEGAQPHPKHGVPGGPVVTGVKLRPVKTRLDEPCPADLSILGTVDTNGATTVTYTWAGSGGKTWPEETVKFTEAGSQSVTTKWKLGKPGKKVDAWILLQVLLPNHIASEKLPLELNCGK